MSRYLPYRQHPPTKIYSLMQKAISSTFYLVQELGPTSFVIRDEDANTFRLSLGSTNKCSCSRTAKDHCIHTLYALLKIFKLKIYNPLV